MLVSLLLVCRVTTYFLLNFLGVLQPRQLAA